MTPWSSWRFSATCRATRSTESFLEVVPLQEGLYRMLQPTDGWISDFMSRYDPARNENRYQCTLWIPCPASGGELLWRINKELDSQIWSEARFVRRSKELEIGCWASHWLLRPMPPDRLEKSFSVLRAAVTSG